MVAAMELILPGLALYLVFVFSTTCHEAAHAYVAKRGGDHTAYALGHVTLDPMPHIRALQQAHSELLVRLAPNYTYETSMPWPIAVSAGRVFPNGTLTLGIGVVFGLFLGGIAAIARNALRRRSTKVSPPGTH